jgi:hypothetical protein
VRGPSMDLRAYSSAQPEPTEWLFCLVCWATTQRFTFRPSTYKLSHGA